MLSVVTPCGLVVKESHILILATAQRFNGPESNFVPIHFPWFSRILNAGTKGRSICVFYNPSRWKVQGPQSEVLMLVLELKMLW